MDLTGYDKQFLLLSHIGFRPVGASMDLLPAGTPVFSGEIQPFAGTDCPAAH